MVNLIVAFILGMIGGCVITYIAMCFHIKRVFLENLFEDKTTITKGEIIMLYDFTTTDNIPENSKVINLTEEDITKMSNKEKGLAMAISKRCFGNNGSYYDLFKKWASE